MSMPWWQGPCRQPDTAAAEAARQRQAILTKPSGSLGDLEVLAIQLAALQGTPLPLLQRTAIAVFAGDHGVVEEGVSAYPQSVTAEMVRNFVRGGAAISVLARQLDAALEVINLGTVTSLEALPGVIDLPLGRGTANFTLTPAMTHDQCQAALQAGRDAVLRAGADGADLFIGGEMGIGNTTAASALASVLLDTSPLALAGPGTGLDANGVARKVAVIQRALLHHGDALKDPYELLRRLGGFELAALTGAYLACAQQGLPTLVDGFICSVAALCAQRLQPATRDWLLFAHCGTEPGHAAVLLALGGEPLLDLGLRLGEGSGAALAVPLLQLSCRLHSEMATFAEANVSSRAHD